jgi:hypothetical protein
MAPQTPVKSEHVHKASVVLKSTATDGIGVDAQFLTQADRRKAIGRGSECGAQEFRLFKGRPAVLLVAGERPER